MKLLHTASMMLLLPALSSCSITNMFDTSGNFDYGKNEIILDTPKNRNLAVNGYAKKIEFEASGKYPKHDWQKGWELSIHSLRTAGNRENPEFYVQYIINERRKLGLPELNLE